MKKVLAVIGPLFKSKKFQLFLIGVLANLGVRYVGLAPETANELAATITKLALAAIAGQAVADLGSGGKTSANGPSA